MKGSVTTLIMPRDMEPTPSRYVALWMFGLALGWFEAAVVVYLRELYYPAGFLFPVVPMPTHVLATELVRELASLVLLAVTGWLAGRRWPDRVGAFLFLFGLWDLVYYAGLKLVLGWPGSLGTSDLLFLLPSPWVGPVWAPALVALAFMAIGSHLFWTGQRPRAYGPSGWLPIGLGSGLIVLSFLTGWDRIEQADPSVFRPWLYWPGLALGVIGYVRAERRR